MKKNVLLMVLVALFALSSCGPKIYKSPDMASRIKKHKTVAILPAAVSISLRPNQAKKMTQKDINDLAEKTAFDIQDQMYGWLLRKGTKFNYSISFQDINTTNNKLKSAGIEYEDFKSTDRAELAKILGVDAVLDSRMIMDKPMSEGAAIALGIAFGVWGATNEVKTTLNLYDSNSGTLIWKYDYMASGSAGSNPTQLVNGLMRNAARKIPYRRG